MRELELAEADCVVAHLLHGCQGVVRLPLLGLTGSEEHVASEHQ
jgi:hypothetical protein